MTSCPHCQRPHAKSHYCPERTLDEYGDLVRGVVNEFKTVYGWSEEEWEDVTSSVLLDICVKSPQSYRNVAGMRTVARTRTIDAMRSQFKRVFPTTGKRGTGSMEAGSKIFVFTTPFATSNDGRIVIRGAGAHGGDLHTQCEARIDAKTVLMRDEALTTVVDGKIVWFTGREEQGGNGQETGDGRLTIGQRDPIDHEARMNANLDYDRLLLLLETIPSTERATFELFHGIGCKPHTLGAIQVKLDRSQGWVKTRLAAATTRLRGLMS